ncbi:MAG: Spo0E family sporulation regulatory protein-aspartic acid phosphatase [Hungatella sp.]|nr:Spo0E family sporulation regulatory protein-aspartic acid phosphatase [Hungatella sp.]
MENAKEELVKKIESARVVLNKSIDEKRRYEEIYKNSVDLDSLIEQYIEAGY